MEANGPINRHDDSSLSSLKNKNTMGTLYSDEDCPSLKIIGVDGAPSNLKKPHKDEKDVTTTEDQIAKGEGLVVAIPDSEDSGGLQNAQGDCHTTALKISCMSIQSDSNDPTGSLVESEKEATFSKHANENETNDDDRSEGDNSFCVADMVVDPTAETSKPMDDVKSPKIDSKTIFKEKVAENRKDGTSPAKNQKKDTKPLMDLRQILKKYEKKTYVPQFSDDDDDDKVDFYGSMSSIPFLKANKKEKKKEKKEKKTKKQERSTMSKSKNKDVAVATISFTKEYDEDDVRLWKSMSAFDGSYMEEVSHRPNVVLPMVPVESPRKNRAHKELKHNERGYHRPDDWVEYGHPIKRSPKKISYKAKKLNETAENDTPSIFVPQMEAAPLDKKEPNNKSYESGTDSRTADTSETKEDVPQKQSLRETVVVSHNAEKENLVTSCELAVHFYDGCIVNGNFRSSEKVERVMADLKLDLFTNDMSLPSFDLCEESPSGVRRILDRTKTLKELNLVPSGHVHVQWQKPMAITMAPGWYLAQNKQNE